MVLVGEVRIMVMDMAAGADTLTLAIGEAIVLGDIRIMAMAMVITVEMAITEAIGIRSAQNMLPHVLQRVAVTVPVSEHGHDLPHPVRA